jgi:hypothetical protein
MLDDQHEAAMAADIIDNFVSLGKDLSTLALRQTLPTLVHSYVATGGLPESALNFKCSTTSLTRFLKRNGLSFRRGRPCRRPDIDEEETEQFTITFHMSLEIFGLGAMVNFDESNWRLVKSAERTVAQRDAESVKRCVNGDVKAAFTFFASVVADGTKLSLVLIAKGKNALYHRQLETHGSFPHEVWHSQNGWCNEVLMVQWLEWLREQIAVPEICLVLDQFDAHDTRRIHEAANSRNIHIVLISKSGTGRYQPRDRRVFGALKAKGRAKWTRQYEANPGVICTRSMAADLLLTCWAEPDQSCVLAGWDLEEDPLESGSSSDESDGEWSLTLVDEPGERSSREEEDSSDGGSIVKDRVARYGYGVS